MALQRDNKLFYFANLTWSLLQITQLLNSYWGKNIKLLVKSNPLPFARFFLKYRNKKYLLTGKNYLYLVPSK